MRISQYHEYEVFNRKAYLLPRSKFLNPETHLFRFSIKLDMRFRKSLNTERPVTSVLSF